VSEDRIDVHSETWAVVQQHANDRIEELRVTIENPLTPDPVRRDCVMRLAEVRAVLSLPTPIKAMPVATPVQY